MERQEGSGRAGSLAGIDGELQLDASHLVLGGEKLVGPGAELAPGTFWKGGKS